MTVKFGGYIDVPLFEAGYTFALGGVPQQWNQSGQVPFVGRQWGAATNAPPNTILSWLASVGGYTHLSHGSIYTSFYSNPLWFNSFSQSITPGGGVLQASGMNRLTFGTIDYNILYSVPNQFATANSPSIFPPASGETNLELKVGSWNHLERVQSPGVNLTNILAIKYGGAEFLGFGLHLGDTIGPVELYSGVDPLTNAQFQIGTYPNPTINRAFMYFPANIYRPNSLLAVFQLQQYMDPDWTYRNGYAYDVDIFDGPLAGYPVGEMSVSRNGWSAVLPAPNISAPGAAWCFAALDFAMLNYYILRVYPQTTDAANVMSKVSTQPTIKIDVDGVLWVMGGYNPGQVFTSFTAELNLNPVPLAIPAATFSLPCHDPCGPVEWPAPDSATPFVEPRTT